MDIAVHLTIMLHTYEKKKSSDLTFSVGIDLLKVPCAHPLLNSPNRTEIQSTLYLAF